MTEKDKTFQKDLTVKTCEELTVWSNKKGTGETVLYKVTAVDEDGKTWEPRQLRSFALLEIGIKMTYSCELYTNPKNGEESITLKRPRQNTKAQLSYQEERLDEAFERIEALETQIVGNAPVPGLPDLPKGWDR
jgi:hypothetical protein